MIELISSLFKEGDFIRLFFNNSSRSVEGTIIKILPSSIAIKSIDGKISGVKGDDIDSFDSDSSANIDEENNELTPVPVEPSIVKKEQTVVKDASNEEGVETEQSNQEVQPLNTGKEAETKEKPSKTDSIETKSISQYKPGDVIPMEVLHRIDPKTAKPKIQKKANATQVFNGLDSLRVLVEAEHKIQNEKYVPALGEVKFAKPENSFGFITDGKTGKELYFSFSQIVDEGISKSSGAMYHMPVVYSIQGTERGEMAITIHRPNKIRELIKIVDKLVEEKNIKHAIRVLDHILIEYPENFTADELKRKLEKTQYNVPNKKKINIPSKYYKAAKQSQEDGDSEKAIQLYIKAIEKSDNVESAIKDLGSLYTSLYKNAPKEEIKGKYRHDAIEFMNRYIDLLKKGLSKWMYLESFYYAIRDFDNFFIAIENILSNVQITNTKDRHILYLNKKAAGLIRAKRIDEAKDIIAKSLDIIPENRSALKLKEIIESYKDEIVESNYDELEDLIKALEFESLTSGLSSFIQHTLDDYTEYAGVPAKVKEAGNFNETTLKGVRGIIDKFSGRSKDRAPYLLTEAKLMQEIEPENTLRLRTILARYCNDMAKTHIADNSSLDVIRFYYNEAFALEENYDNNAQNVAYFILTHICDYRELLQVTTRDVSVDYALKKAINGEFDIKRWINILSMFLYNRVISAKLTSLFYSNAEYKVQAITALNNLGIHIKTTPSKEEFIDAWNTARETLKRYNNNITAAIRTITNSSSLEDLYQQLLLLNELRKEWMYALDISRLYTIVNSIAPTISSYLKSSGYRYKESNRNLANGQITQLIEEIRKEPTKLSFEEFLPLLDSMGVLLANSFREVIRMSEPRINIRLLSERTVINDNGIVNIQIEIANNKDSSPIKEVSISTDERDDLKLVNGGEILYNAIEGGESHIFKLQFKVSEEVINQKATAITIHCNYRNGNDVKQTSNQLSLKLYSQEEFAPIENPYAPNADGGPMEWDSKMFFGREVEIKNIVDAIVKSPSKQIIIYGQKRSGKSSVLNRIQHNLQDTGIIFCVSFSLGAIVRSLNEASFYYKIIHSIKQELDLLTIDGIENIPKFEIPSAKDFKEEDEENPLNTFTNYMIKFKLSCKQTSGWENKRLVVLIDEFTYLYTEIKKGNISPSIMKQWKAITQNERAQFSVVLVGQDVVPSFKKEDYARNAFGVIQDMRLTYLKDKPARELIEIPILDEEGHSRYIGEAVSRIIEYTSRNPYYIQIFCSRLVDYMNNNKSISVTEADVNEVARSFIYGSDALEEDKFDNLIRAGESEDLQEHSEADIMAVLRQIALNSKNIGYCNRADINVLGDEDKENAILKDLYDRDVLEMKGEDNYKIQVKLFQEWLLNH